MATAFDNEEYLRAWKEEGVFPRIHRDMFNLFSSTFECNSVLDMCSCTGLLGTHIMEYHKIPAFGLEGNETWLARADKWGITLPTLRCWIGPETLDEVVDFIKDNKINGMVARRCLAELFAYDSNFKLMKKPDMVWAKKLTTAFVDAGIKEIWMEGGKPMKNPETHPVPNTDAGIKCFAPAYRVSERLNECVYMVAN